jgi:transposase
VWDAVSYANGLNDFLKLASRGWEINPDEGASPFFPPEAAMHLVRLACERPDDVGRSLSQWHCQDLANQLISEQIVPNISVATVQRILSSHKLKPWRHHMWLYPKERRDAEFYQKISDIIDLYTRPLAENELVVCLDEKTSLQPRPRSHKTKPAQAGNIPNLCEHEYKRAGALNLFAAFDTRSGKVYGRCYERKRQEELISFLEYIEAEIPPTITTIHVVCDNLSTHHGKKVRQWLDKHARFKFHFTPKHCSWMNQAEQWFSILQRKRFRIADFESKDDMGDKVYQFISEWNEQAHPFNWSKKSVAKIMAQAPVDKAA